jgi:hypothetical protein
MKLFMEWIAAWTAVNLISIAATVTKRNYFDSRQTNVHKGQTAKSAKAAVRNALVGSVSIVWYSYM